MTSTASIRFCLSRVVWAIVLWSLASARPAPAEDAGGTMNQHLSGEANRHMHRNDFDELVERFESPDRAEWQKPDVVIDRLGDLEGKTVADIGAGTGYFTFPVSVKAGKVIAIDIDQRMLDYIRQRMEKDGAGSNIETRLAAPDDPGLNPGEADVVLIVNTYHHIENRADYLGTLRAGMSRGARLIIVEFHKKELPVGPPPDMKLEPDRVNGELREAGFADLDVDVDSLPYQYIVTATRE